LAVPILIRNTETNQNKPQFFLVSQENKPKKRNRLSFSVFWFKPKKQTKNFYFYFAIQTEKQPKQIEFRVVSVGTDKKVIASRTPYSPASPGRSGVIVFSLLGSNQKQMLLLSGCSAFYCSELFL
jgi:hypothetical protein